MKNKKLFEETAGYLMIPKEQLPVFLFTKKISEIKKEFQEKLKFYEASYYIYLVDEEEKLVGVLSERELFSANINVSAKEIMKTNLVKVFSETDQEEVAILAIEHHLTAIPVVDEKGRFLGIVPPRTIFKILHSEHLEDFLKSAGIHSLPIQALNAPPSFQIKSRLPWLLLGLFGGFLAARLAESFENPLKEYFILTAFIPLIVYMADAIGTQTQTLFVRNLVLRKLKFKDYLLKETKTGLGISLILGFLLFLFSFLWSRKLFIGLILGVSMFSTGMAAIFVPILVVVLLTKLNKDPAIGSGPFATIIQDLISLIIYFSIATFLLKIFT